MGQWRGSAELRICKSMLIPDGAGLEFRALFGCHWQVTNVGDIPDMRRAFCMIC